MKENLNYIFLLVNKLDEYGGVSTFVNTLSKGFRNQGYITILIGIDGEKPSRQNSTFSEIYSYITDHEKIAKLFKEKNAIVISTQIMAHFKVQNHLKNQKCFVMFHGDTHELLNGNQYKIERLMINGLFLKNVAKYVLISPKNREFFAKHANPIVAQKSAFAFNPFASEFKNAYKKSGKFVYLGRLSPEKNLLPLIEIFHRLSQSTDFTLHIYGTGPLKNTLKETIEKKDLDSRIYMHGFTDDLNKVFADTQGLVLTSHTEGTPFVILEAYSFGIPVYAWNSFLAADEMIVKETGKLTKFGDIDEYCNSITSGLLPDTDKMEKILNLFLEEHSLNHWINDIFVIQQGLPRRSIYHILKLVMCIPQTIKCRLLYYSISFKRSVIKRQKNRTQFP